MLGILLFKCFYIRNGVQEVCLEEVHHMRYIRCLLLIREIQVAGLRLPHILGVIPRHLFEQEDDVLVIILIFVGIVSSKLHQSHQFFSLGLIQLDREANGTRAVLAVLNLGRTPFTATRFAVQARRSNVRRVKVNRVSHIRGGSTLTGAKPWFKSYENVLGNSTLGRPNVSIFYLGMCSKK